MNARTSSALLDSFAQAFAARRADRFDASRRDAFDAALRDGLPGPRSEAWKYTSLRALERRGFASTDTAAATVDADSLRALLAGIPSPRLVFVNGRYEAAHSDTGGLPAGARSLPLSQALREDEERESNFLGRRFERTDARAGDDVFARLNAALADDGAVLRIDAGVDAGVVHLVFVGAPASGDLAWHSRHLIDLRTDAALTVVEHHLALGEHRHLVNQLAHVHLGQHAHLRHARAQREADGGTSILRTDAVLARDARYDRVDLELGAALSRHELNVRLEGEGARLRANGVLLASGKRHLDTRLGIEHIARDTACDLLWRGLGAGRGRSVFHGGIVIREGADGSDASLSNKNLLLSDNAEIDTQPVLVIHADEVKAAHGATVGQLDATALFYLRSRGLPEAEARALLTVAFCRDALHGVEDTGLREWLTATLDTALANIGSAGA